MAECKKNCVRQGPTNFNSKITTIANVHLMESLLDDWLKISHINVDIKQLDYELEISIA